MDNHKRHILNNFNFSTFLGLLISKIIGGTTIKLDNKIYINYGRKGKYNKAWAITIGDVILARKEKDCEQCKSGHAWDLPNRILRHELIHSEQFAKFGGVIFLALYSFASIKSFIIYRNHWQGNIYEIQAGLKDGGYI